jgi:hypothetical protein
MKKDARQDPPEPRTAGAAFRKGSPVSPLLANLYMRRFVPFALDIDRYDFAIKVAMENGYPVARKFEAVASG